MYGKCGIIGNGAFFVKVKLLCLSVGTKIHTAGNRHNARTKKS